MAKKADSKEVKSSKSAKKPKDKKKKGGVKKYFRDLKSEIKKVVWPSRSKVINNTGVVIALMIVLGLALFGIDSLTGVGVSALLSIGA
ncbi:MAG: preprotein translocase subunit SecE [Ruminococcus sp.]|nr:preprotein translocase subunit SecE [Ruminococcus sp.]